MLRLNGRKVFSVFCQDLLVPKVSLKFSIMTAERLGKIEMCPPIKMLNMKMVNAWHETKMVMKGRDVKQIRTILSNATKKVNIAIANGTVRPSVSFKLLKRT
jgi:hypothetical protein